MNLLVHTDFAFYSRGWITRPRSPRGTGGRGPAMPIRRAHSCWPARPRPHYCCAAHQLEKPSVAALLLPHPGYHRARAVNQKSSEVSIAALAHTQQHVLAAARALARHEAQPRSQLTSAGEIPGITHACYERARADRADAGNGGQFATQFVTAVPCLNLRSHLVSLATKLHEVLR